MTLREMLGVLTEAPLREPLPVVFLGHGNPMNAISDTVYTKAWRTLGESLPRPRAILVVSAHWLTDQLVVDTSATQKLIYDFYGFPDELYRVKYPAQGDPHLAKTFLKGLSPEYTILEEERGLDHGAWSVLSHVFPKAEIPVFQLSINFSQGPEFHYELGKALSVLSEYGVLILGSGNIVHNLGAINWKPGAPAYPWASAFDTGVAHALLAHDDAHLLRYQEIGADALKSVPTPDHYYPFLVSLGAGAKRKHVMFPVEGIDMGSVSMRSVLWK